MKPHRLSSLIILSVLACAGPILQAAPLKRAEITAVVNDVKVVDPRKGERTAGVEDVIAGDLSVRTGIKSRAELLFQDKTLTRLGATTLFSFNEGTRELELGHGTILLQAPKGAGGAKVRTAAVTAAITGTTILLEYSPAAIKLGRPPVAVSPDVAALPPPQCCQELEKPRREYSRADLAELRRKCKAARNAGHVKVMVLEGTLRLYLNKRVGESVLVQAGQMIILSPEALNIPPAVDFDIARLAETSLLVNNRHWGGPGGALNPRLIDQAIAQQNQLKGNGGLLKTNLLINGRGTNVMVLAQLDSSTNANPAANPQPQPGQSGNQSGAVVLAPTPPVPPAAAPGTLVGSVLPGFAAEGSTTVVAGGAPPPPTSPSIPGLFSIEQSLPGTVPVLPTEGSDFALFSTGGSVPGLGSRTATKVATSFAFPAAAPGTRQALSFDYRFFSNETNQGATFPDQFNVTIASGSESIVLALDRNALSPNGNGILTPIAQAGVAGFLGGTDWLPFTIDITPFAGTTGTVTFLVWDVGDAVVDSAFAVDNFGTGAYPGSTAPAIPGGLTLNFNALTLGNAPGEFAIPNLEGLPARDNAGPAADAGAFTVNATNNIVLNAPLNASTGANGAGTTYGGRGGAVRFTSTSGEIAINSTLKVSESATVGGKASAAGGTIGLTSNKTTGTAISISNTGELLSLLNAAAVGPGGTVTLSSAGGAILVNGGRLTADRGTIDIRNTGAAGLVQLDAAQLAADVVKVGALGTDGQLTITAGSQISAATALKLYGGAGALGKVHFTGAGNVNISGSPIHIAGRTVQIDAATQVQNTGTTNVHTDNVQFGVGAGGGKFQNPVTTGPLSGAPPF